MKFEFRHGDGTKHVDGPMLPQTEGLLQREARIGVSGKRKQII